MPEVIIALKEQVVGIVRKKLQNPEISDDDIVFGVDETEQVIKNCCNVSEVPHGLKYTWANMATDITKHFYYFNNSVDTDTADIENVKIDSVKIGDTQLTIGSGTGDYNTDKARTAHNGNLDSIIMNYREQLRDYRRLRW